MIDLLLAVLLQPQPLPPPVHSNQKFAWEAPAPSLAVAQGYTYKYYPDNAAVGIVFQNVTCTEPTPSVFTCTTPIPAFTPGNHSIQITASDLDVESDKSDSFAFTFVVKPGKPLNVRIGG